MQSARGGAALGRPLRSECGCWAEGSEAQTPAPGAVSESSLDLKMESSDSLVVAGHP